MEHDASAPRGRPRKRDKFDKPISVRLTSADRTAFIEKVRQSGMSQADFFRECVLTNRTTIVARAPASADRKRALFVLNKAGNNLNQIAHVLNAARLDKSATGQTYESALDALEQIELLLKAHLRHVA
jgi:MobC-like protein